MVRTDHRAGAFAGDAQRSVSARPNFIIVMADDLGAGMDAGAAVACSACSGDRGATFENAFASYPLCCPARATLLTGQYAHNHGAKGNSPRSGGGYRALIEPERNLAAWLQANGYATAFAGKWLNGLRTPRQAPPGWDEWWGLVGEGGDGLSSFYDYDVFEIGGAATALRHRRRRLPDRRADAGVRAAVHRPRRRRAANPFFLWLAYHPPHNGLGRDDRAGTRAARRPAGLARRHAERDPGRRATPGASCARRLPRRPSFDERDVADKPSFVRRRTPLSDEDLERIERDHRCGLAALLALDEAIAEIVVAARAPAASSSDTVLIFTADHGVLAGRAPDHSAARTRPTRRRSGSRCVIRGPGIAAGARLAAAGRQRRPRADDPRSRRCRGAGGARAADRRHLAGRRSWPASRADDRAILIEGRDNVARPRNGFKVRSYVGVRTARYAYVEYRRASFDTGRRGSRRRSAPAASPTRELYDLQPRPASSCETLPATPAYARTRESLDALLAGARGLLGGVVRGARRRAMSGAWAVARCALKAWRQRADRALMFDIDSALRYLVEHEGSDLHVKVPSPPMVRIHGELQPIEGRRAAAARGHRARAARDPRATRPCSRSSSATARSTSPTRSPGLSRFRVNAFRQRGSVSIACRAIPYQVRTIEELDLPPVIRTLADEPRGIVLLTGTTGSGKSTTLAAMVDHINSTRARHIITLEDPIEYLHRDKRSIINQREVGADTESFGRAMRRVLRQDPDVILIGEMRDEETVRTALSAAETGHLVLSTLHTLDATETVNRIIDFFPPHLQQQARVMLAATLRGVVGQRLDPQAPDGDGRVAVCEVLVSTGPRPGPDPQPRGDRQDQRGDRRGRVLRHADLRPGAAQGSDGRQASTRRPPSRPPRARTTSSSCSTPRASAPAASSR